MDIVKWPYRTQLTKTIHLKELDCMGYSVFQKVLVKTPDLIIHSRARRKLLLRGVYSVL